MPQLSRIATAAGAAVLTAALGAGLAAPAHAAGGRPADAQQIRAVPATGPDAKPVLGGKDEQRIEQELRKFLQAYAPELPADRVTRFVDAASGPVAALLGRPDLKPLLRTARALAEQIRGSALSHMDTHRLFMALVDEIKKAGPVAPEVKSVLMQLIGKAYADVRHTLAIAGLVLELVPPSRAK